MRRPLALAALAAALPAAPAAAQPSPVVVLARNTADGRVVTTVADARTLAPRATLRLRGRRTSIAAPSPDGARVLLGTAAGNATTLLRLHTVRVPRGTVERTVALRPRGVLRTAVWRSPRRALVLTADARVDGSAVVRTLVVDPLSGRVVRRTATEGALLDSVPYGDGLLLLLGDVAGTNRRIVVLGDDGRATVPVPVGGAGAVVGLTRDPETGHALLLASDDRRLVDVDVRTGATTLTELPLTGANFQLAGPRAVVSSDDPQRGPGQLLALAPRTHAVLRTLPATVPQPSSPTSTLVHDTVSTRRLRAYDAAGRLRWSAASVGRAVQVGPLVYASEVREGRDLLTVRDAESGKRLARRPGPFSFVPPSLGYGGPQPDRIRIPA